MTTLDAVALEQALQSTTDAWVALRDSLTGATAIESLVLLPLVERAAQLQSGIAALLVARSSDHLAESR